MVVGMVGYVAWTATPTFVIGIRHGSTKVLSITLVTDAIHL